MTRMCNQLSQLLTGSVFLNSIIYLLFVSKASGINNISETCCSKARKRNFCPVNCNSKFNFDHPPKMFDSMEPGRQPSTSNNVSSLRPGYLKCIKRILFCTNYLTWYPLIYTVHNITCALPLIFAQLQFTS